MEMNMSLFLNIFLVLVLVFLVLIMWMFRVNEKINKEEKELLKKQYPNLTDTDKKYRNLCLTHYYNYYFKKLSKIYKIIPFILVLTFGIMFGCLFSQNEKGATLCLTIFILLMSLRSLLSPNLKQQQFFWEEYLEKNPDNPLKVILLPIDKKVRLYKLFKLRAIYGLFLGLYALFMVGILFFN